MKTLPFEKVVLNSKLNENQLISRLNEYVEPDKLFRFEGFQDSSNKLYVGKICERNFFIRRIISGRNSFNPYINGKIENLGTGCKIIVTMRPRNETMVILLFFICGGIYFMNKTHAFAALFIILYVYIMLVYFFNKACKIAKVDLQTMLEAHIECVIE